MSRFDYFVVFAEMRTGSNFLEANLNAFDGISCLGEAFNNHFIGYPNRTEVLGITQSQRDADPAALIAAIKADTAGRPSAISGFRYFHDHDPRVLGIVLPDPRCAKIVLTRNPVESYVSRKIAAATGQWKLTNVKFAKSETVRFSQSEFIRHLEAAWRLRSWHEGPVHGGAVKLHQLARLNTFNVLAAVQRVDVERLG